MENLIELIGTIVSKKQLGEMIPAIDTTKKGGAWQSEFRRGQAYGDIEIVGRKYLVNEIYETPKELVHGNTGKEPSNKGQFDKNSLKYKLAQTLINLKFNSYLTKNGYLDAMGFKSKNIENFNRLFANVKYVELNTIDKFAFDEVQEAETSLKRLIGKAIEIIASGEFPNVQVFEEHWYVDIDDKHYEAENLGDDWEQLHELYKQASKEAKEIVEAEYGKKLVFGIKMNLINDVFDQLKLEKNEYAELYNNGIKFFYTKYIVQDDNESKPKQIDYDFEALDYDGTDAESQEASGIAYDFFEEFLQHRVDNATKENGAVDKFIKAGIVGDFFNRKIMVEFVKLFVPFIYEGQKYSFFKKFYEQMIAEAKENYQEAIEAYEEELDEQLPF